MQAIHSKNTSIEIKTGKALWNRGIRFRRNVSSLYGKPDFAIKKYKVVLFIDGCFWHGCEYHGNMPKSNKEYWSKKLSRNKERDIEVTNHYISEGWNILRIWEHELKYNFEETITKIVSFINEAKQLKL